MVTSNEASKHQRRIEDSILPHIQKSGVRILPNTFEQETQKRQFLLPGWQKSTEMNWLKLEIHPIPNT